jgi:hypothetical protein
MVAHERVAEMFEQFSAKMQADGVGLCDATLIAVTFVAHAAAATAFYLCDDEDERDECVEFLIETFARHARGRAREECRKAAMH